MYPILFEIGPLVISSFGLMMVLAFFASNHLIKKDIKKAGFDPSLGDDIIFRAAIGGIIGAKLYYIIENLSNGAGVENLKGLLDIFFGIITINLEKISIGIQNFGSGLVFLGGLMGGLILVTHYVYKNELSWFVVADWVAPYLALGHGIGRIGCFLVGDCYGIPSNLPWACAFPKGLPPTDIHVHPTQLYEMIAYFSVFGYLTFNKYKIRFSGQLMFEYLFLVGFSRFIIEFLRTNPKYLFGLSGAQHISMIMIIVSMYFMYVNRKK